MAKPERIQLSRMRGWRMPENAVKVDRSTAWGNPFVAGMPSGIFAEGYGKGGRAEVMIPELSLAQCLEFYRALVQGIQYPEMVPHAAPWSERFRKRFGQHPAEVARCLLRGKDLGCWCKLGDPCHGDVLLEIANA